MPVTVEPQSQILPPQAESENRETEGEEESAPVNASSLPSPGEYVRRGAVAPLVGLDDEGQTGDRVSKRIGEMARAALPPPINDPPGYPELVLDEDGNHTWHIYYLVAKIRPDGTVFFIRDNSYRRGKGSTGRYCHRLSTEPGQCEEQPTVPWPDDWGMPLGRFPENPIKMWFLRQTVVLRDQLSALSYRQDLASSVSNAQGHADGIWCDSSLSKRSRRRLLFDLWDECEEAFDEQDRRPVARAGQKAREGIVRYIRREIPFGSPDAYSRGEIHALNASRASKQEFEPYD